MSEKEKIEQDKPSDEKPAFNFPTEYSKLSFAIKKFNSFHKESLSIKKLLTQDEINDKLQALIDEYIKILKSCTQCGLIKKGTKLKISNRNDIDSYTKQIEGNLNSKQPAVFKEIQRTAELLINYRSAIQYTCSLCEWHLQTKPIPGLIDIQVIELPSASSPESVSIPSQINRIRAHYRKIIDTMGPMDEQTKKKYLKQELHSLIPFTSFKESSYTIESFKQYYFDLLITIAGRSNLLLNPKFKMTVLNFQKKGKWTRTHEIRPFLNEIITLPFSQHTDLVNVIIHISDMYLLLIDHFNSLNNKTRLVIKETVYLVDYLLKRKFNILSAIEVLRKFIEDKTLEFHSFEELAESWEKLGQTWLTSQNSKEKDQTELSKHTDSTTTSFSTISSSLTSPPKSKEQGLELKKKSPNSNPVMQDPIAAVRGIPAILAQYQQHIFKDLSFIQIYPFIDTFIATMLRNHTANWLQTNKEPEQVELFEMHRCIDSILMQYNSLFTTNHDFLPSFDKKSSLTSKETSSHTPAQELEKDPKFYAEKYKKAFVGIGFIKRRLELTRNNETTLPEFKSNLEVLFINCENCNVALLADLKDKLKVYWNYENDKSDRIIAHQRLIAFNTLMPIDDIFSQWKNLFLSQCESEGCKVPQTVEENSQFVNFLKKNFHKSFVKKPSIRVELLKDILLSLSDMKEFIRIIIDHLADIINKKAHTLQVALEAESLDIKKRPDNMIIVDAINNAIALDDSVKVFSLLNYMLQSYCYLAQEKQTENSNSTSSSTSSTTLSSRLLHPELAQQLEAFQNIFRFAINLSPTNKTAETIISYINPPTVPQKQELADCKSETPTPPDHKSETPTTKLPTAQLYNAIGEELLSSEEDDITCLHPYIQDGATIMSLFTYCIITKRDSDRAIEIFDFLIKQSGFSFSWTGSKTSTEPANPVKNLKEYITDTFTTHSTHPSATALLKHITDKPKIRHRGSSASFPPSSTSSDSSSSSPHSSISFPFSGSSYSDSNSDSIRSSISFPFSDSSYSDSNSDSISSSSSSSEPSNSSSSNSISSSSTSSSSTSSSEPDYSSPSNSNSSSSTSSSDSNRSDDSTDDNASNGVIYDNQLVITDDHFSLTTLK